VKIIFATDVYFPMVGGVPVAVQHLTTELSRRGHHVSIIAPSSSWKSYEEMENKVTIYRIGSFGLVKTRDLRLAADILRIAEVINQEKPDVIHIESSGVIAQAAIITARAMHIPIVGTTHVIADNLLSPLHLPKVVESPVEYFLNKQIIGTFKHLDAVTSPSQIAADLFEKTGIDIPISVISNGLYLDTFHKKDLALEKKLVDQFNIKQNIPLIVYVGRIDQEKRVDVLLRALAIVKKDMDFQAILVGKGTEQNAIEELMHQLDLTSNIILPGYVKDEELPSIYHLGTLYVMPGDAELQSISTLEAMASGLPVVAANALALPLLVKDNKNGFLFEANNEKDLAQKIEIILKDKDLQESMGKESQQMVLVHDMNHVIGEYEKVYKTVIAKKKKKIFFHRLLPH